MVLGFVPQRAGVSASVMCENLPHMNERLQNLYTKINPWIMECAIQSFKGFSHVCVSFLLVSKINQFSPYRRMMKHQHQSINVKLHHEGLHHFGSGCSSLGCLQWEVSSVTSIWSESQLSKYHDGFQPNLISDIIPVHHWQGSHRQAPAQVWIQKCVICPGEQNQKASIPQTSAFK